MGITALSSRATVVPMSHGPQRGVNEAERERGRERERDRAGDSPSVTLHPIRRLVQATFRGGGGHFCGWLARSATSQGLVHLSTPTPLPTHHPLALDLRNVQDLRSLLLVYYSRTWIRVVRKYMSLTYKPPSHRRVREAVVAVRRVHESHTSIGNLYPVQAPRESRVEVRDTRSRPNGCVSNRRIIAGRGL